MKLVKVLLSVATIITGSLLAEAQGTFQNRGFESASVPAIPGGQYGGLVPFSDAFPFWTGYAGTNTFTQVYENNVTLGSPTITILGPNWPTEDIITGRYTALLQTGFNGSIVDVTLAQVGVLPSDAQYLSLKARGDQVSASFDGQNISLFPVGNGSNYVLYEGDVSRFAGQLGELRVSLEPTSTKPYTLAYLDSIKLRAHPGAGSWRTLRGRRLGSRTPFPATTLENEAKIVMSLQSSLVFCAVFYALYSAGAQGAFQNRGFESASLQPIPAGQYGGFVPFSDAFPFWTGYAGTNVMTQALQNNETLGAPNISILGPNWPGEQILTGHYSALLQAGFDPFNNVGVALGQVGMLPSDVQYLSLKASGNQVSASFDGQDISLFPAGGGSNYILYEGDISRFAGHMGELRISSEPTSINPYNGFFLDSINFVPIPEPGVGALCVVGGLVLDSAFGEGSAK